MKTKDITLFLSILAIIACAPSQPNYSSSKAVKECRVTSNPSEATICFGESKDTIKCSDLVTAYSWSGNCWKAMYFQVKKQGFKDSEIIFQPESCADRKVHFNLVQLDIYRNWLKYQESIRQENDEANWKGLPFDNTSSSNVLVPQYVPISPEKADSVIKQYRSIPGGITLEGTVIGLDKLKKIEKVQFFKNSSYFLINGKYKYVASIKPEDILEILNAIEREDLLGVSLGRQDMEILYGNLSKEGNVATNLKIADKFLGSIVFADDNILKGYHFANNYVLKKRKSKMDFYSIAVYFNFNNYTFIEKNSNIFLDRAGLDIALIPLKDTKNSEGGHQPDNQAILNSKIPEEYLANIQHLNENINYYLRERIFRLAKSYGEVAAFARFLKSNGITINKNIIMS